MTPKIETLRQISLFAHLKDTELERLAADMRHRRYARGEIIFHKGAPGDSLYLILTGRVRIYTVSVKGHEISINVYADGQVFGEFSLLDEQPRSASAVAMTNTTTLTLCRADFQRHLRECPTIAEGVISTLVERVRYTTEYAERLAFLDARGRLASRLLELAERFGVPTEEGIRIELELITDDLASLAWATREWTSKVLNDYCREKMIRWDRRKRTIVILDTERLESRVR